MWIKKQNKTSYRKLSGEILELLLLSLVISLFFGAFLYFMSLSIAENYLGGRDIFLNEIQAGTLRVWLPFRGCCSFYGTVFDIVWSENFVSHFDYQGRGSASAKGHGVPD